VTLPGAPSQPVGRLHVLSTTRRELEDIFLGLGFTVMEGPEVETVHYNFDALNHSPTHPARARTDTFYVSGELVLRTHTSPMQVRYMETHEPPIRIAVPGRCYRYEATDATHEWMLQQVELLVVGEGVTLADLKGTLLEFARAVFGETREVRLRPHFFPSPSPASRSTSPASL
jgi:phenylalanyl-tRNA synthetase alpha chain